LAASIVKGNGQLIKKRLQDFAGDYAIVLALMLLALVVSIIQPKFFSVQNFRNILNQISVVGILSCGMTFVILIGCIDLSVGSMISLAGIVSVILLDRAGGVSSIFLTVILGAFIGLATGLVIGGINGRMGESFMVTYGMQSVLAALALIVSGSLFMMVTVSKGVYMWK
jgi:ribose/xylose/arabinose/galactoside ABC-type transport system permease subunit